MEAIILAGGFGTRLKHVVLDVPKPMAPFNGKPFLKYLFDYLLKNGVTHIILAAGYKAEVIQKYFGDNYKGIGITYSVEDKPLGTGGAIKKALEFCNEDDVFILNGDTYFDVDLNEMKEFHAYKDSKLTVAIKPMSHFDRYGVVVIENYMIKKFDEKKPTVHGKINGGTYLIKKTIFNSVDEDSFSFEKGILESGVVDIYAFESEGYFIDIGVPEDYYRAQKDFLDINKKNNGRCCRINKAVFLDRDGTINKEVKYLYNPNDFTFISGAVEAIKTFHELGYRVIVITNQAGVAKGYYTESDVQTLHQDIDELLTAEDTYIDAYYYCPHHPEGTVEEYRGECKCRKPHIGMIEQAVNDFDIDLSESIIVGDKEIDVQTGKNAGIGKCVLVRSGHPIDEIKTLADNIFDNILELAENLYKNNMK